MNKKALIVVDLQKDFLCDGRKPMFSYNTKELIDNVNDSIDRCLKDGYDIIYIRQVYQNIVTNRKLIGFAIKGTPGADLYDGLNIVSDNVFEKYFPNTYTSKAFREFMQKGGYSEVAICGVDECGCVGATAKGAVKAGMKVSMLTGSIGTRFPDHKVQKLRKKLSGMGVIYI